MCGYIFDLYTGNAIPRRRFDLAVCLGGHSIVNSFIALFAENENHNKNKNHNNLKRQYNKCYTNI